MKKTHIIIYVFDLSKDDDINEKFINEIKENGYKKVIYLVGNKLDLGVKNVEKYRKKAKILIYRGKIHKYFELSVKTKYDIDLFLEYLKNYSTIIKDNNFIDPFMEDFEKKKRIFEMKYNLLKYQNL